MPGPTQRCERWRRLASEGGAMEKSRMVFQISLILCVAGWVTAAEVRSRSISMPSGTTWAGDRTPPRAWSNPAGRLTLVSGHYGNSNLFERVGTARTLVNDYALVVKGTTDL